MKQINALHIQTPLLKSQAMSLQTGQSVWLKIDALQPSGSFKIRGIGFACQEYAREGVKRFISSSGGNAGIAVAYAGRILSIPVIVVVPETTTERAKSLIQQEGAEVIVHGASWQEANEFALSIIKETDAFLHPFDNPFIWQGHATIMDEVAQFGLEPDAIILSVGGGGLLSGVVEGLQRNKWENIPVIAVETEGADSFFQSIKAGCRVELPAITSIATSLGARKVCKRAFDLSQQYPIHSVVVSDKAAISACEQFIIDQRIVVEPACGAALAAVYGQVKEVKPFKSVLIIVCGGVCTSIEQLRQWSNK
ncbi:MAG: pyridoxal-phosphate dependent enzyme [Anaerolineaceae bacterium]